MYCIQTFIRLCQEYDEEDKLDDVGKFNLYKNLYNWRFLIDEPLKQSISALWKRVYYAGNEQLLKTIEETFALRINATHLYRDKHNVHCFVTSSLDVAKNLMQKYPKQFSKLVKLDFYKDLYNQNVDIDVTKLDCFFETINHTFHDIIILDLFASIYMYIKQHEYSCCLFLRLVEEMYDSNNVCLSGHVVRLINCVQGFDMEYTISNDYEYNKAKVFHILNTNIDIYDFDLKAIEKFVNSHLFEVEDVVLLSILEQYTKTLWRFVNGLYLVNVMA